MTDSKTATERLREMLDALNIEHFDYDKGGRTQTQWEAPDGKRHFTYETSNNPAKTARLVIAWHPTPEQAITATLGGRLTAEQVRDFLNRHSVFNDTTWLHGRQELVFDENELQAMVDELNCTLGSGECEFVIEDNMNETEGMGDVWFRCTGCDMTYDYYAGDWLMKQNYCPNCGRRVKR